jgi:hypothetical protein
MGPRPLFTAVAVAALAVPAAVLADGIGPHSSYYDQHPHPTKPGNDVSIVVNRKKKTADFFVNNFCLGSQGSDSQTYPNSASARGVAVSHGKIAFHGKATIFTQTGREQVAERFTATITRKKATGTAKFPKKPACGTISFTAKLAKRTK